MILQIWKNENLSPRAKSSHKKWLANLQAEHVDIVQRFHAVCETYTKIGGALIERMLPRVIMRMVVVERFAMQLWQPLCRSLVCRGYIFCGVHRTAVFCFTIDGLPSLLYFLL